MFLQTPKKKLRHKYINVFSLKQQSGSPSPSSSLVSYRTAGRSEQLQEDHTRVEQSDWNPRVHPLSSFVPVQEWHWNQLLQHGMATPVPSAPTHQTLWVSNKVRRPPISWARCNVNLWYRKMYPCISLLASWGQILSSRRGCFNVSGRKTNTKLLRYKSKKFCELTEGKLDAALRIQCLRLQWWRQSCYCSSTRGQMTRKSFQTFFNPSGFPAEVVHSSPTISNFVKLLPTP